ncbi:MAG: MoaD/ThiS family protein [Alphaproteobacteria bacterium]|nr:MoaD/ThiS family protein [Pseudomonadota bacterium]
MKLKIKLLGRLRHKLPAGSGFNQTELDLAEGAGLLDVMAKLGLPAEASYLITVNDEQVRPSAFATHRLNAGDAVSIFPPLQGG